MPRIKINENGLTAAQRDKLAYAAQLIQAARDANLNVADIESMFSRPEAAADKSD